jgi:hypothetical protein
MERKIHNKTSNAFQIIGTCVGDRLEQSKPFISDHHWRELR